tara:strand:- start:626 stop:757 length:132 start_codon:yes stop_codon:yes gene_type:complete
MIGKTLIQQAIEAKKKKEMKEELQEAIMEAMAYKMVDKKKKNE